MEISDSAQIVKDLALQGKSLEIVEITNSAGIPGVPEKVPAALVRTKNNVKVTALTSMFEEYAERPFRNVMNEVVSDKNSFIEFVKRFSRPEQVMFARLEPLQKDISLDRFYTTARVQFNYNESSEQGGRPNFDEMGLTFNVRLTPAFYEWYNSNERVMPQGAFADFLSERIMDVVDVNTAPDNVKQFIDRLMVQVGTPSDLLGLSKGMALTIRRNVTNAVNLDTGEAQIQFDETHTGKSNKDLIVPNLFLIGVQVFEGDVISYIPVRLRYTIDEGKVRWYYRIVRLQETMHNILKQYYDDIAKELNIPLFLQ